MVFFLLCRLASILCKASSEGYIWAAIILAFSWITDLIFKTLNKPISSAGGADLFALVFAAMLLAFAFESWPFNKVKQPLQGLLVIVSTLLLTTALYPIMYYVFQVTDYFIMIRTVTVWCFFAIMAWFTEPWLVGLWKMLKNQVNIWCHIFFSDTYRKWALISYSCFASVFT